MKVTKAHCPTCDGERNCLIHGKTKKNWTWKDGRGNSVDGGNEYSLLECQGCETVFYEEASWNSEDMNQWYEPDGEVDGEYRVSKNTYPTPMLKVIPIWLDAMFKVDAGLLNILREMYVAYENRAYVLATIGLRTALDKGTEILKINTSLSFEQKLDELEKAGLIGKSEKEVLDVVTNAGHAAAHRGWEPDKNQIDLLLNALEVFLQRAFIVGTKALDVKSNIPAKKQRD